MIEFIKDPNGDAITIKIDSDNTIVVGKDRTGEVYVCHYNLTRRVQEMSIENSHYFSGDHYDHNAMQSIAYKHNLGQIEWVEKIALNTGKPMEVGYIRKNGSRQLFCKSSSFQGGFYLCNDFRGLT